MIDFLLKLIISSIAVAGRAPPEPYYGRYIGEFTNFAHGIKVSSHLCFIVCLLCFIGGFHFIKIEMNSEMITVT